jgi:hypothetical protein
MSPITLFPGFWRLPNRSAVRAPAGTDTPAHSAAAMPANAVVRRDPCSRETERPVLRRPRRSRHDGVLGLRWLA